MAIDLDDSARDAIAALLARLARRFDSGRLRWTPPPQLHLTLAFIGETADPAAASILDAMSAPIDAPAYTLVLSGLGVFPPRGAPRILWIGSAAGARETIDVQRIVADRLAGVGVELERRPFHPHLTVGRWRDSGASDRQALLDAADAREIARFAVDHVTLYQSHLSSHGATYSVLARTPLAPARM